MILRNEGNVIPGEQRETRNPGGITVGLCCKSLDSRIRGNDVRGTIPQNIWIDC